MNNTPLNPDTETTNEDTKSNKLNPEPARSPLGLPIAVDESGKPWNFNIHHPIVFGITGSGRGKPVKG